MLEKITKLYDTWWYATEADKARCNALVQSIASEHVTMPSLKVGNVLDEQLRDARCLDHYSYLFGGDGLAYGSAMLTQSSSVERVGEYLFVYINSFVDSREDLIQKISALDTETVAAVKTVVLDVRGNPGGSVDVLHSVLNTMFAPSAGIRYLQPQGKMTFGTYFETDRKGVFAGRTIRILTDRESASSTEWMIETLCYEWYPDKCLSVGSTTLGKAILQCIDSKTGHTVKLTCAEWFLADRRASEERRKVQGIGIAPDKPMVFKDCDRYAYKCIALELAQAGL
jgi:C-terminal processing protease CtpA/Prc